MGKNYNNSFFSFCLLLLILETISFKQGNGLLIRLINSLADYVKDSAKILRSLRIT